MPEYTTELRAKVDVLRESVNDAGMPYVERMGALFSLANAIAPYTTHIDAQAKRIAELEAENARLREALMAVRDGHGCQPGYLSHSAMQIVTAALKDTAQ